MTIHWAEVLIAALPLAVGGLIAGGRLEARVKVTEGEIEKKVDKEVIVAELRGISHRLDMIERKLP